MQKMLYIFLSKCSCGKLFGALYFFAAAGNPYPYWLSALTSRKERFLYFLSDRFIQLPSMAKAGRSFLPWHVHHFMQQVQKSLV